MLVWGLLGGRPGHYILWKLVRDGGDSLFDEVCSIRHDGRSVAIVSITAAIAMVGGSEGGT